MSLDPAEPRILPAPPRWPEPPASEAFFGLVGEIAQAIAPHTEADPVALLVQMLIGAGAIIGRGAWFSVEATRHHPAEFAVLVGDSAKARKGSSWDHVARVLTSADPSFPELVHSGLSTGEGLIFAARGSNRRLLVMEPEFVSVLKATARDHATLSPVLRAAWDGRPLAILTRSAPVHAPSAHIALIGHITRTELAHHLDAIEAANGFLNRFVFVACRRQRLLPEGGAVDPLAASDLTERLAHNLAAAKHLGELHFHPDARELWAEIYERLADEGPATLAAALGARSEAHVLRLSMLYALSEGQGIITATHLASGFALYNYTAASVAWATTATVADPVAEQIAVALNRAPEGLTRTELRDLFGRNLPAARIDAALSTLGAAGRISRHRAATAGRPAEIWSARHP